MGDSLIKTVPLFDSSKAIAADLSRGGFSFEKEFVVTRDFCFRFDFAFDSLVIVDTLPWARGKKRVTVGLLSLVTDDFKTTPFSETFFNHELQYTDGKWRLHYGIQYPKKETGWRDTMTGPLTPGTPYCLEYRVTADSDSIARTVEFRINGESQWKVDTRALGFKLKRQIVRVGSREPRYTMRGHFFIDNIAFGEGWQGHPPARPRVSAMQGSLHSPPFRRWLSPSNHAATRYEIQIAGKAWELPLYDSGPDSANKDSLSLPFPLEPRTHYLWRLRHYGSDGNASDWSLPASLSPGSGPAPGAPVIYSACFCLPGGSAPLDTIVRGRWYDFVATLSAPDFMFKNSYAIFWLNNAGYTLGSAENKGGQFFPGCSYAFNFSFEPNKVFEKRDAGSFKTSRLDGAVGLYLDAAGNHFQVQPRDHLLRCRARLLEEAGVGKWSLRGFASNEQELKSPLFYATLTVIAGPLTPTPAHSRRTRLLWVGLVLFMSALAVLWNVLRKRTGPPAPEKISRETESFKKFDAYVRLNLEREIEVGSLEKEMGMSYSNLYRIVKTVTRKSIMNYILGLKLEKAMELFRSTNKNVTEVAFALGFNDASHFSKMFKKYTGKTPREFRE